MRVLWVKTEKLLPLENAGNISAYHILRHLASPNEWTFHSYYGGKPGSDYERELQPQLPGAAGTANLVPTGRA
jgi:hypothetical protein